MANLDENLGGWLERGEWDWDLAEVPFEEEDSVYDDFEDDDDEEDEFDEAVANCAMDEDGVCGKAGSEECDWECPFSR